MIYRVTRWRSTLHLYGGGEMNELLSVRTYQRRWLARLMYAIAYFPPPLRVGLLLVYHRAELQPVGVPGGVHSNDFPCRCDACRRPRLVVNNDEGAIDDHLLH